ncbi:MAG: NAD(P)-dependent oxidoreductase, partial [Burkholderiaceae bacterium]
MRIAVLGTGMMGAPMARRLCEAGHEVHVWNRTRAKAEPLAAHGARVHDTARDAVAQAELVVSMLENGPITEAVLFDAESGAAAAMRAGMLVVDMASIKPAEAREHAARLAAAGVAHVDAPVSG